MRGEDGLAICLSQIQKTPENLSASDTGKPHKKESCCVHVLTDLSKLFGLPEPPRGELPARGTS